jgi:peptide/nickel transport system substrate-binding protein
MLSNRWIAIPVAVGVILSLLVACGPTPTPQIIKETVVVTKEVVVTATPPAATPSPTTAPAPAEAPTPTGPSGTLVVLQTGEADLMDPHLTKARPANDVAKYNVCEPLVGRFGEWLLAESMEFPDDLTQRFHLRKGVKFHNGDDFTAEAVKFSIERFLDPDLAAPYASSLAMVDRVDVVDDYTVDLITKEPSGLVSEGLYHALVLNPRVVEERGGDLNNDISEVCTGPFKFVEWMPGEKIVMEANEEYWGGSPRVKTVVFKGVAEASVRIAELKARTADIVCGVPAALISEVQTPWSHAVTNTALDSMVVAFNCKDPPLDDVRVRQAISYAVNMEELIEFVMHGAGEPMNGALCPSYPGYDPDLKPYPYDPEKAKELLAEAGYADGFEITFVPNRLPYTVELSEAISGQLAPLGIDVKVEAYELPTWYEYYLARNGYVTPTDFWPTDAMLGLTFDCSMQEFAWHGYCNDEFDALLAKARTAMDREEREALWRQANKIVRDEAAELYIACTKDIYGVRDRVQNFTPRPDAFVAVKDVYLSEQ